MVSAVCLRALVLLSALACLVKAFVPSGGAPAGAGRLSWRSAAAQLRLQQQQHQRRQVAMQAEPETPYERVKHGIFDTEGSLDYIFESNKRWVQEVTSADPDVFTRLKHAQQPKYLYIGCSDSRVPAQNMLGLTTGELFVHRNVANLCVNTDYSLLSVLTYAVEVLQVTDIIVCGHYGCGGVRAAMENLDHGLLEHWLMHIRNVQRLHQSELSTIPDEEERHRRLVELNVQEACMNLFANPVVQKKQATDSQPRIHGWVYDIATGFLKDLKIDFRSEIKKYKNIYSLYEFPRPNGATAAADADAPAPAAPNGRMGPRKTRSTEDSATVAAAEQV